MTVWVMMRGMGRWRMQTWKLVVHFSQLTGDDE